MADEYDIQQSLLEQDEEFLMQNRQYTWIPDSNGDSYAAGSQIVIDGSPLANHHLLQIPEDYRECNNLTHMIL